MVGAAARVRQDLGKRVAHRVVPVGARFVDKPTKYAVISANGKQVRIATVNREYHEVGGNTVWYKKADIRLVNVTANLVPQAKAMLARLRGPGARIVVGDHLTGQRSALSEKGGQILFTTSFPGGTRQLDKVGIEVDDNGQLTLANPHRDNTHNLHKTIPTRQ
jgi:hypothetical protein